MEANPELDQLIVANGINGATGEYLVPPKEESEFARVVAAGRTDEELIRLLKSSSEPHLGALYGVDLTKPCEAGWAIVFHEKEDPEVIKVLQPLIEHRRKKIENDKIVKVLDYQEGESTIEWLARNCIGMGDIDPEKVPFYILLIGSPTKIPFLFGHLLDAIYGVGRLYFTAVDQYATYVNNIIAYETAATLPNSRDVHFFGTRHIADKATKLSSTRLVQPLAVGDQDQQSLLHRLAASKFKEVYRGHYLSPDQSTKQALHDIFHPPDEKPIPALLFTASHGAGWPIEDQRQKTAQGALVCQDYPGPGFGSVNDNQYFAAADLDGSARVSGLVCFHFACYGVGTPQEDRFFHKDGAAPPQIAVAPFFSPLPQALLSHTNGSALGVFGHVERAWPNSILAMGAGVQLLPFINALSHILLGHPLGFALKDFNERYAVYSILLASLLEKRQNGLPASDSDLASTWTSRNDAEAYILFGDPGVQLRKDLLIHSTT